MPAPLASGTAVRAVAVAVDWASSGSRPRSSSPGCPSARAGRRSPSSRPGRGDRVDPEDTHEERLNRRRDRDVELTRVGAAVGRVLEWRDNQCRRRSSSRSSAASASAYSVGVRRAAGQVDRAGEGRGVGGTLDPQGVGPVPGHVDDDRDDAEEGDDRPRRRSPGSGHSSGASRPECRRPLLGASKHASERRQLVGFSDMTVLSVMVSVAGPADRRTSRSPRAG